MAKQPGAVGDPLVAPGRKLEEVEDPVGARIPAGEERREALGTTGWSGP
jgi:hypothetical protein